MVGISDLGKAVDSRSSNAGAMNNLLAIVKQINEAEIFLSAARSYVDTSKTVLENLKRYLCIAEADILFAKECITKSEMRLQRIHLELQSLFQKMFYQDLGYNQYVSEERKAQSTQTTSSMSEHVLDTIKRYAKDKLIDLGNCTATCDEYDGTTIVILHPNIKQSENSHNLKSYSSGSNISNLRNMSESNASASGNVANRDYTTLKDSESIQENFGSVAFNNPQWEASCEQQPDVQTESVVREGTYNSKPTHMSCEIHQLENDSPLPVKELRQHSFQTDACNVCPNLTKSMNEASFSCQNIQGKCSTIINFPVKSSEDICDSHQIFLVCKNAKHFTQIGSKQNAENLPSEDIRDLRQIFLMRKNAERFSETGSKRNAANGQTSTRSSEFPKSKKKDSNKISGRQLDVTQTEGTRVGYSRNHDSFSPEKKNEILDVNGNALFVTQSEGDLTEASQNLDFIWNKDNDQSGSGSASHACSSRETILMVPLQSRLSTDMLFQSTSEARSQTGAEKATFCNSRAISSTKNSKEKLVVADKLRRGKCDRRNKADVLRCERFSPDITLESTIELNDENESNTSKIATLNIASNISKTTDFLNSNTIHGKPYSFSQNEASNKRSFKFLKEITDAKKSDSENSISNQTSPEENTNIIRKANFWENEQEQLNLKAVSCGNNSRKSNKCSEYYSNKKHFGQEDNKNMLSADGYLDCSFLEVTASDNPSFKVEFERFHTSSELREPDYEFEYKCASDMNYVNIFPETSESERFQNVSSTATNHSRFSKTPRNPEHSFDDHCFGIFHSPNGGTGSLADNAFNVNASFTNTGSSLKNNFEKLQDFSNISPSSRTSVLPLVSSFLDSSTPMQVSSSSVASNDSTP